MAVLSPRVGLLLGLPFLSLTGTEAWGQNSAPLDSVSVFPNPAHIRATVVVPAVAGATKATVTLLDAQGTMVFEQPVSLFSGEGGTAEVPLLGRQPGLYRVQVRAGEQHAARTLRVE
ncbi:T9SS type A sorting domain-containing protein [Hymenobacter properus]|uniref:T9SS type A sorting domain-containing protein n=1 Tax=Hymenobacter properus TaxID=2791026 RepID=A0A931FNM1_9BACT|nr:T9SS type A sorting domain-containing protein [Hymenobacter properus]MBF9142784.1 T9SS type A sorting domain-containing protein [Hymenobacter properus]MBR7721592.1 T9SS type A sorting domain-containing protein [Microvirga sp. SRT04]